MQVILPLKAPEIFQKNPKISRNVCRDFQDLLKVILLTWDCLRLSKLLGETISSAPVMVSLLWLNSTKLRKMLIAIVNQCITF